MSFMRLSTVAKSKELNRDMRFPTMWHLDMNRALETPNAVRTVRNIQATSKCPDHTARMQWLVCAFAGHTYHIFGNLGSRLTDLFIKGLL